MLHSPLTAVAAAVLLGAVGQVIASITRMPAIVFLLVLGVAAGPYGLGVVQPRALGPGLPVLTSAFVAIILFEGGLTLRPGVLRHAIAAVRGLITVGAAVTLCGTALLSHQLVRLPWPQAFLFAALVVVTGPTVIAPILRRVRLMPRLSAALKSESILIDPIGAIVAVVAMEYLMAVGTSRQEHWNDVVLGLLRRGAVGVLVGALVGLAAVAAGQLRFFHKHERGHLINLGAVGLALGTYVVADRLQPESGILAVIVAGLVLAAGPIPYRKELERFKEHLARLGVSVLFILLAANLNLRLLADAGWREAALLLGLILVVRPAAVFLSTLGTSLTWREKAYLSLVAPRGILAAAMASYFTVQLREQGLEGADRIEMLAFLVIGVTVCLQGSWAAVLARVLRVRAEQSHGVLLVGVNEWSLAVAEEVRRRGRPVLFLDNNAAHCEVAHDLGFEAHQGDATDEETYGDHEGPHDAARRPWSLS
jgi:NhaP-type Na+/H+ or K+/H+ antiporter